MVKEHYFLKEVFNMKRIFVSGLTSSGYGGMEFHNLGNFIIVEPLFENLRKVFPDYEICTTMQMTTGFYERHRLIPKNEERFWRQSSPRTLALSLIDLIRVMMYKIIRLDWLLKSTLLQEINRSDIYLDFSGDIYGDNANAIAFIEASLRILLAKFLGKKTAIIIGSPGPFSSIWRQYIAKKVIQQTDLITNREPLSTAMLAYIGIKGDHIHSTACPSIFFRKEDIENMPRNSDYSKLFAQRKPTIGFILCGWNMAGFPYNKWPRSDSEYQPFMDLIHYILERTDYRICVMSHQNATDSKGNLVRGNDHKIIDRLLELLGETKERVFTLEGLYTASQSKTIISTFDVLISGRIHGAVQGLSQYIPTMIIDYGHEPKAHKLRGFARVYGIDGYVADPCDGKNLIMCASKLLDNKLLIQDHLKRKVPEVMRLANSNFELIKCLLSEGTVLKSKK